MYEWLEGNHENISISLCCAALSVRREGYYDYLKRPKRKSKDEPLILALQEIRKEHPCYGTQSMIDELPDALRVSYGKAYKLCRDNGLLTKRCKPRGLTKADPKAQLSEDLVQRDFTAEKPGIKAFTDITEMGCSDGKLYFCGLLDAFDGAQIGYSMAEHMRAELCVAAVVNANRRYILERGCIIHSDRGAQFTSHLFRETLAKHGLKQSMGRTGSCFDNARAESFFATLKRELIYRLPLSRMSRKEVKHAIFTWIESYYNRKRRNTANEHNLAPLKKREAYNKQLLAA